ncbi:MAG: SUMF1/EgtB/PvdO family nonheme iron enzyme [Treponema sp.]|nr:SUMF1/EgtB/PvdO family nonheme iron enzyme [Treponema sp.]
MALKQWKDGVDAASVAVFGELGNFKVVGKSFLSKKNPFAYDENIITMADGFCVDLYNGEKWNQFTNRNDMTLNPAELLDTGDTLQMGKDYYIYLVFSGATPEIVVSLNATFPDGATALTSRKIGGFHYGTIRKVSDDGLYIPIDSAGNKFGSSGTKWEDNVTTGIIPNSVWDLKNRPKNFAPGFVKVGNIWVSIYQASAKTPVTFMDNTNGLHIANGELQSKYGELPATGTEGLNQFAFNELAHKQGLRLPSYAEWLFGAFGNPQGENGADNYGWTKTSNTARTRTGCSVNTITGSYDVTSGVKPYAVSAYNLCDCTGNIAEWTEDYTIRQDSTNWSWQNVLGAKMGQAYLPFANGLSALFCGHGWNGGLRCGARTVNADDFPWHVGAYIGARLACDAA